MKSAGYILMVAGLIGVLLGFASLIYPLLHKSQSIQETSVIHRDPDGDDRVFGVVQRFVYGVGGGMLMFAVGGYVRTLECSRKKER